MSAERKSTCVTLDSGQDRKTCVRTPCVEALGIMVVSVMQEGSSYGTMRVRGRGVSSLCLAGCRSAMISSRELDWVCCSNANSSASGIADTDAMAMERISDSPSRAACLPAYVASEGIIDESVILAVVSTTTFADGDMLARARSSSVHTPTAPRSETKRRCGNVNVIECPGASAPNDGGILVDNDSSRGHLLKAPMISGRELDDNGVSEK